MLYNAGRHSCNGKLQNVTGLRWRPRQRMACLMRSLRLVVIPILWLVMLPVSLRRVTMVEIPLQWIIDAGFTGRGQRRFAWSRGLGLGSHFMIHEFTLTPCATAWHATAWYMELAWQAFQRNAPQWSMAWHVTCSMAWHGRHAHPAEQLGNP